MTFEDVKKFAVKNGCEADEYSIRIKDFQIYKEGAIWINTRTYSPKTIQFSFLMASSRTPKQMKSFIESLL